MRFARLLPDPADVDADDQLTGLRLGERAPEGRPYLVLNFVATADGRAAWDGRSAPLGDEGDQEVFFRLRTQVDAVMVGTGTLRVERYGRIMRKPERRAARAREGLAEDPLAVVVSRSGRIPAEAPLWDEPEQAVALFVPPGTPTPGRGADVRLSEIDPVSFRAALSALRAEHGVRSLLCEGGPTVASALLADGLVDELFLTVTPKLAGGGDAPAITSGAPLAAPAPLELVWALEREGSLFLRYRVRR